MSVSESDPEDPILKNIKLTIDPKYCSILLKMVKIGSLRNQYQYNIGNGIDQY